MTYEKHVYREPESDDPIYVSTVRVVDNETPANGEGYVKWFWEDCRVTIGYPTKQVERWRSARKLGWTKNPEQPQGD